MMNLFRNTIVGAAIGAGAFAFSVISASAYIVCNDTRVCWHTHNPYDYPPEAHVTVHDDPRRLLPLDTRLRRPPPNAH